MFAKAKVDFMLADSKALIDFLLEVSYRTFSGIAAARNTYECEIHKRAELLGERELDLKDPRTREKSL